MSNELMKSDFVEPYFVEQLGDEGLSASDIAKSLGAEPKHIREKISSRGFLERMKSQEFQAVAVATPNKITGLSFDEYFLDVEAAKFFVAKYDSPLGDAYLAFLIRLERKMTQLEADIKSDPFLYSIAQDFKFRQRQLAAEKRLEVVEETAVKVSEAILDSTLSTVQRKLLKDMIDAKARSLGGIRLAGALLKDMKRHFGLNPTNDRWYDIPQRRYKEAEKFVAAWGW